MDLPFHSSHARRREPRTPEALVDDILSARGNGLAFIEALGGITRQPWDDDWQLAERIVRVVQARGHSNAIGALERSSLVAHFVQGAEYARAATNPRFLDVDRELDRIRIALTGDENSLQDLRSISPEYGALEQEWEDIVASESARWLELLGEPELARLKREQPEAFDRMIEAGHIALSAGLADATEALDYAIPENADETALLALMVAARGTAKAAEMMESITAGLWLSQDKIHAAASVRFAQMLEAEGHYRDNERFFVVNALAEPLVSALGMRSKRFVDIVTRLLAIEHEHNLETGQFAIDDAPVEYRLLYDEFTAVRDEQTALWLEELGEAEMARLLRDDRAEYERRCEAGRESLLGLQGGDAPDGP